MSPPTPSDLPTSPADFATTGSFPPPPAPKEKPPSLWSYPATYLLIGINVAVYAIMCFSGPVADLARQHQWGHLFTAQFDVDTTLRFGGCDSALVLLYNQWWRLLTAIFVHGTFLHIALNMWCLWNLGVFGEPLLGRRGLVAVYLLTGIAGNILSIAWNAATAPGPLVYGDPNTDSIVVGASGAVFGIAGILIILLSNRKLSLPWKELRSLRAQVIFFAVANLAIGLAPHFTPIFSPGQLHTLHIDPANLPRIDNSAHLGGLVAGLALGLPLFPRMASGKQSYRERQRRTFAFAALLLCLIAYAVKAFARP